MNSLSSPVLIDTHCHLDFHDFQQDRLAVLETARQAGVVNWINPAVDAASSQSIVQLCQSIPGLYAAVGVHPNEALTWDSSTLDRLKSLASQLKVIAVGEIGLDFYRDKAPKKLQIDILNQQLDLAANLDLPVIIHNRESSIALLDILQTWISELKSKNKPLAVRPGVLHSFSGNHLDAQRAISMGFYIGITGPVTYRNALDLQSLVTMLPLDRILIETDSPFLTPQQHRGKRNEPAYVCFVAKKIAELRNIPFEEVAYNTTANARTLFQIGEKTLV